MYEINKDLKTETKIFAGLYLFDILILGIGFGVAMVTNKLLPVTFRLPYMIMILAGLIFFIMPSRDNPGKRNYQSLQYVFGRSRETYHRVNEFDQEGPPSKRISRTVLEKLSIQRMDEHGVFYREEDLFDIIELKPQDLYALNQDQINNLIREWHSLYLSYEADLKFVMMRYPNDMYHQRMAIEDLLNTPELPEHRKRLLTLKIEELNRLEMKQSKEYYVFVYADNPELLNAQKNTLRTRLPGKAYTEISIPKKLTILQRLYNPIEG